MTDNAFPGGAPVRGAWADHLFAGSGKLARFILRRDRVRLILWLAGLAGFVALLAPVFEHVVLTGTDDRMMAEMMKNPAMIAMVGPVYGAEHFTAGAAFGNMMLVFSVMLAGVMNIFLIARHTRQDEELGRLEVIRSLPVGRLANLASALLVSAGANAVLALGTGLGLALLRAGGMSVSGCLLFGAAMGVTGLFFAAATAVFCQCTANNRTALGVAFLFLFVLYMLRAAGDVGTEALSLASPLGLILRIESFVNDYWWPVGIVLLLSAALAVMAFVLARMRDLGRGLVPERPGRRHASALLSGPAGLALKLIRTPLLVWSIIVFVLAAMYGSVFGDLEGFIAGNDMLAAIFAGTPDYSLTEQFITLLMAIMAMIAAIPALQFVNRVAAEEKRGHTEHLAGRAVSRYAQMSAYFTPAFVMSGVFQLLAALGFWSVGSVVMADVPSLGTFLLAAISYTPAIWALLGLAAALVAFIPRLVSLSYLYLGYSFLSVYLGAIAGLPEWTRKLSPFGLIPSYPIEPMDPLPLVVLTAAAAILTAAGFWGYRRRDVETQ